MPRDRLGDILIKAGLLDQAGLQRALNEQRRWGGLLGQYLVQLNLISEENLVRALSAQYKLPAVALDAPKLDIGIAKLVPQRICEKHCLICFRADTKNRFLDVAMANPAMTDAIDEVRVATQYNVRPYIAGPGAINAAIRYVFYGDVHIGDEVELTPSSPLRADHRPPPTPQAREDSPTVRRLSVDPRKQKGADDDDLPLNAPISLGLEVTTRKAAPIEPKDSGFHISLDAPALELEAPSEDITIEERLNYLEALAERDSLILERLLNALLGKKLLSAAEIEALMRSK